MKKNKNISEKKQNLTKNQTIVSFVDRDNNWKGSITRGSSCVTVTVNSISGLFSRCENLTREKT